MQVEAKISSVEKKVEQGEEKIMAELSDIKTILRKLSNTK